MSQRPTILIVDDERHTREGLARALRGDYAVAVAENGQRALEWLETHAADVILTDLRMPHMDGLQLLAHLLGREPKPIVIMLTAYGNVETAVEAMKRGAYDFLAKPVNQDRLELLLIRALAERQLGAENQRLRAELDSKYGFANIIGTSPAMQAVFDTIRHVAPTKATVLIQGESGTGKELVARALHQGSPRREGPFVPVHCAALAPTLLESELFGHEKGAFTGAVERRRGRFELADGGTLFLDEIGEIEPALQVKILRALEERSFERVGGTQTVTVNVRLVAATNKDLRQLVAAGKFREDLFYRLYVVSLSLPPLRERDGDIVLLTQHYLKTLAAENGKPVPTLSAEAMDALSAYAWPGNVRELRNVIERMVVLNSSGQLTLHDVPATVTQGSGDSRGDTTRAGRVLRDTERQLIEDALRQHRGNRTQAARHLGISRRTLHRKLNQFGLRSRSND